VNARFIKPLDTKMLLGLASKAKVLITAEDHALQGGLGSAVAETLMDANANVRLVRLGIPDVTVPHGDPAAQHEELGYGPKAIGKKLQELGLAKPTFAQASD
jgi:1-deoxy-D-xylulose-5-phosphate synthase